MLLSAKKASSEQCRFVFPVLLQIKVRARKRFVVVCTNSVLEILASDFAEMSLKVRHPP
jgi:hypothetical protein